MPGTGLLPKLNSDMQLSRIMSVERSPRLPAILPKPESLPFSQVRDVPPRYPVASVPPELYNEPLPSVSIRRHDSPVYQHTAPPLRLDTSRLDPPSASVHTPAHVDMPRLRSVYERHKSAFWTVIADDYGLNASAVALEQAWKSGACCQYSESNPITPLASPVKDRRPGYPMAGQDKTRISSILDDDTEPRLR
jgi:hypothetical protein